MPLSTVKESAVALKILNLEALGFSQEEIRDSANNQLFHNCLYIADNLGMSSVSAPWILHPKFGKVFSDFVEADISEYRCLENLDALNRMSIAPQGINVLQGLAAALREVRKNKDPLTLEAFAIYGISHNLSTEQLREHAHKYHLTSRADVADLVDLRMAMERVDRFSLFKLAKAYS